MVIIDVYSFRNILLEANTQALRILFLFKWFWALERIAKHWFTVKNSSFSLNHLQPVKFHVIILQVFNNRKNKCDEILSRFDRKHVLIRPLYTVINGFLRWSFAKFLTVHKTVFLEISLFPIFWDRRGSNQFNTKTLGTKEKQTCLLQNLQD